jgi:hypothetical protein
VTAGVTDGDLAEVPTVPEEELGVGAGRCDSEHATKAKIIKPAAHVPSSPIWSPDQPFSTVSFRPVSIMVQFAEARSASA